MSDAFTNLWLALKFAWLGITDIWKHEPTGQHEIYATVVLLPLAWWWPSLPVAWSLGLTASWMLVMLVEALTRAIISVLDAVFIEFLGALAKATHLSTLAIVLALFMNILLWLAALVQYGPWSV